MAAGACRKHACLVCCTVAAHLHHAGVHSSCSCFKHRERLSQGLETGFVSLGSLNKFLFLVSFLPGVWILAKVLQPFVVHINLTSTERLHICVSQGLVQMLVLRVVS